MNPSQIYILIGIITLAIVVSLIYFVRKQKPEKRLSKIAVFSFIFIMAGMIFNENRLVGYGLMGIGVVLAIIDIVKKMKK